MTKVVVSRKAQAGIRRCYAYLRVRSKSAAERARDAIFGAFKILEDFPRHGRPFIPLEDEFPPEPDLRELVIPFGKGAYVALYRYIPKRNVVTVIAFKHGQEESY